VEWCKGDPSDPAVVAPYRAMIEETIAQYPLLERELGLKIELIARPD
jgi:hypothetical protein